MAFIKKHIKSSIAIAILILGGIAMAATGTLSYPYILFDRQIQSIRDCTFGSQYFNSVTNKFSFSAPEGYCVLPNRLFPVDGSVEIVPKGWYFVINEYAKGTVAKGSAVTLLFEPVTSERDPKKIIQTLIHGNFAEEKNVSTLTTPNGTVFTTLTNTRGTDDNFYDWAFTVHPDKKVFLAVVTKHTEQNPAKDFLLNSIQTN